MDKNLWVKGLTDESTLEVDERTAAIIKAGLFFAIIEFMYPEDKEWDIAVRTHNIIEEYKKQGVYPETLNEKIVLTFKEYVKQKGGYPKEKESNEL